MPQKRAPLSNDELLKALPPLVEALARKGVIRSYRANTTLITEGDRGENVFVVLSGTVRIFCSETTGKEITLALYEPGEYVGEMSLDGGVRSASVVTESLCVCSMVNGLVMREHLIQQPEFALELIQRLIRRTRLATASARSLALLDAYGRLTHLLNGLAIELSDGTRRIREKLTHLALAQRIGCTRELVSRILKDLESGGYIAVEDRRFMLLKKLPAKW